MNAAKQRFVMRDGCYAEKENIDAWAISASHRQRVGEQEAHGAEGLV
jgi:hypothetical protein